MTKVTVKNGEFIFESPLARYRFFKRAEGKEVRLETNDKPTPQMRKYFEGCVVPAFFYMHPRSGWQSFADAREVLKLEFGPGVREVEDLDGNTVKVFPSTADHNRDTFEKFIDAITTWMRECGIDEAILDEVRYKKWRDTNFSDWVYPPLARLKELYDAQKAP